VVFDLGRGWFGLRIVPGGVFVFHAIDFKRVVVRGAFPGALAGVLAGLEKFLFHCVRREILIPFHYDAEITFCDDFSGPRCFWHFNFPGDYARK